MDPVSLIFFFIIIIPSAIIHEYFHAWMADYLGDPTARNLGRLTLNLIPHIDLWGTILMPLLLFAISGGRFLFAYAKPVPFNPYNLKNQRWGPALVGIAGPTSNILVALVFGILVRLLPVSPFTGLLSVIVFANILLAVFNLIPIPPLDGSKVLFAFLPDSMNNFKIQLERMGFLLLLVFIFFAFNLIQPLINWLFTLFVGSNSVFL